jgi:hypothetical protein
MQVINHIVKLLYFNVLCNVKVLKYQFSSFLFIHFVFRRNTATNGMEGSLTNYKKIFGASACCIMEHILPVFLTTSNYFQRVQQVMV